MRTRRSPRNQERLWKALGGVPSGKADQGGSTPPHSTSYTPGELYDLVVARGLEHDSHYSDLYLKDTPEARQLIACYRSRSSVTSFISNIAPHVRWFDIPFAYAPYWRERCKG